MTLLAIGQLLKEAGKKYWSDKGPRLALHLPFTRHLPFPPCCWR